MFANVVLAVDLAEPSSWAKALPVAAEICRSMKAKLYVVTVASEVNVQVATFFPDDANERLMQQAATDLQRWTDEHAPPGIEVHRLVAQGPVHREVIAAAEKVGADLIVMASHKPGLADYLLGANAAHVMRHAGCSVMVVRS